MEFIFHFQGSNLSNKDRSEIHRKRGAREHRDHTYEAAKNLNFIDLEQMTEEQRNSPIFGPTTRRQWSEWVAKPRDSNCKENQVSWFCCVSDLIG